MKCKIQNCQNPIMSLDLCKMHYWRIRRHGDPNKRLRRANGEGSFRGRRLCFSLPNGRKVQNAILVVEKVLGHELPKGVVIHHINEDESDDSHSNLVVCQDQGLHNIIHGRLNALKACGHARWKPCKFCQKYSAEILLVKNGTSHYHVSCQREDQRKRKREIINNRKESVE